MVQEGDFVARGTQLFTFEDTRQAEVLCNLTLSELNQIRKHAARLAHQNVDILAPSESEDLAEGDLSSVYRLPKTPVAIEDPSNPGVIWDGVLERFDGIGVDSVTKTIPCRIAVKQPIVETESGNYALVRGMFVRCRLEFHVSSGGGESPYLAIPEQAVQPNHHVWTVKDNRLKRKPIEVVDYVRTTPVAGSNLLSDTPRLAIVARTEYGPKTGDQVVVSPLSQPSDDAEVELTDADALAGNGSTSKTSSPPSIESSEGSAPSQAENGMEDTQ